MSTFDRDDISAENQYDYAIFRARDFPHNDESTTSEKSYDVAWLSVGRFVLTLLLRIGFVLVQIGCIPVTNINLILLQNIVDFSWITIVYVIGGFVIAFNGDVNGLIGEGRWIGDEGIDSEEALIGWQAATVASAICTSCLVGRTHTIGYLLIGAIMSGIVQPFAIHWAWTSKGWMARNSLQDRTVIFHDYAGSSIVHTFGSLTGYIGCAILGRRIIRLRDIDDASIPADSAGTALAGYFLVLLGLQSLCFPSTATDNLRTSKMKMSLIVVNNLLAASSCSLVVVALHFIHNSREPFNHWTVMRCVQATIAGTTIISAGVDHYNSAMCLGLGFSGGIIHYLASRRVFESALEDYCNVVATHLVCSLIGSLVAPFGNVTSGEIVKEPRTMLLNVAWQIICLAANVTLVIVTMTIAFGLLECLGLLRNRAEIVNHLRAVVATERGPTRSCMQRLFLPEGETLYLQPCTAHARRQQAIGSKPRLLKPQQTVTTKISKTKSLDIVEVNEKTVNPNIFVATTSPNQVHKTRIKKFRQIHTLKSKSEIDFSKLAKDKEAMGDSQISVVNEKTLPSNVAMGIWKNKEISIIECSGDSSIKKYAILEPAKRKCIADNYLKRRHEPYKLHKTQKFTNLRLEAINENNDGMEFLVRPRKPSFSSTETDSEDENHETPRKYPKNSPTPIPLTLIEKISKCTEISS